MPVHPAFAGHFDLLDGVESYPQAARDPAAGRKLGAYQKATLGTPPPVVPTRMEAAAGPHGPVPLRVYEPPGGTGHRPGLVWLHGGAFIAGDLDMVEADWVAREVATRAGAVVVSVDYRLALDGVHHPVPHDDAVAAVRWVRDHVDELGIDPAALTLGGASAGGTLAAGAAVRLRDDDAWQPVHLVLVYPVLHAVLPPPTPELDRLMTEVPSIFRFTPEDQVWINRNYLGGPLSRADGYAFPALAPLDGLCPATVHLAEYDDLRPSGAAFTAALALAGVDVTQRTARGLLHGFLSHSAGIPPVGAVVDDIAATVAGRGR